MNKSASDGNLYYRSDLKISPTLKKKLSSNGNLQITPQPSILPNFTINFTFKIPRTQKIHSPRKKPIRSETVDMTGKN